MSVVISLGECIARPDDERGQHLLTCHLLAVANACGVADGTREERLCFLAGLLHDAGKATPAWQKYIRRPTASGPRHSAVGSLLFAVYADKMAADAQDRATAAWLCRDIADHHSGLDNLCINCPPWKGHGAEQAVPEIDLEGLADLVEAHLGIRCSRQEIEAQLDSMPDVWNNWCNKMGLFSDRYLKTGVKYQRAVDLCRSIRLRTGRLVFGDRAHAGSFSTEFLTEDAARDALDRLVTGCEQKAEEAIADGADPGLVGLRQQSAEQAVQLYLQHPDQTMYTLPLGTGIGKTLTSLRVALTAAVEGGCKRIIYAAPYVSILSQATDEIRKATGLPVVQHHHLSVLDSEIASADTFIDLLDSWQAPVITTTFNQLLRALFPVRAQETMRMPSLEDSFIIVDEPQVMDAGAWTAVLAMLESCAEMGARVLIASATIPGSVIEPQVVKLASDLVVPERYEVCVSGEMDKEMVAEAVLAQLETSGSAAVILNTIKDAADVYELIQGSTNITCLLVTGCMTALHKSWQIGQIRGLLEKKKQVVVVSTQVLEAGVDLSFPVLFRALPILPSIVQAAGRVNRHREWPGGKLIVFDFLREQGKKSRKYVYKDKNAVKISDRIIGQHSSWSEDQSRELVHDYYDQLLRRDPGSQQLENFIKATKGEWCRLGGLDPFQDSGNYTEDVFVPWLPQPLTAVESVWAWCRLFGIGAPEELYELYEQPGYIASLERVQKKQFMALLQQFVVPVPTKLAKAVSVERNNRRIRLVSDRELYCSSRGFAGISSDDWSLLCS